MPKIRDLGVNRLPGYWMCATVEQWSKEEPPECQASSPECAQSNNPKNGSGLPHSAIVQLRQQLEHQINRQLHG